MSHWLALVAAVGLVWTLLWGSAEWGVPTHPLTVLQSGITHGMRDVRVSFRHIPTEVFNQYSGMACVTKAPPEAALTALNRSLHHVPLAVRQRLLLHHVYLGAGSVESEATDCTSDAAGRSTVYHARWAVQALPAGEFSICIAVSGLGFVAAEVLAGHRNVTESRVVAYAKSKCNWRGHCDVTPVLEQHVTQEPIFKRHVMTLVDQIELKQFLVGLTHETIVQALPPSPLTPIEYNSKAT